MNNHIKHINSDSFTELRDLSEQEEQEFSSGGFSILIEDINTFARDEISATDGTRSLYSKKETGYSLSRIRFDFGEWFGNSMRRMRKYGFSPLNLLSRLLFLSFTRQ
ncbi:hypothetical protein [Chlorogloeopsis sp. ULAP02]|uniref:hypothetical protein n=1 Tax=Chlorogloeopsis sp. ULAP02 TaxID=3107926 RepID=UPI00313471D2